jgi:hypothetical protein
MERELADSETPFTDYQVEDCEGLPRAVFDQLPPEQSSLLSAFLYPDKAYIGALYLEILKVSDGEIPWMSYEDDLFKFSAGGKYVEVESKEPLEKTKACVRVKMSLSEAKFLLLKWRFECMRWEAVRWSTGDIAAGAAESSSTF